MVDPQGSAPCNDTAWPCGRVFSSCTTYDDAGLCPKDKKEQLDPISLVFGLCGTSKRVSRNRALYGQHLETSGLPAIYLVDEELSAVDMRSWSKSSPAEVEYRISSLAPSSFGKWATTGERCAFTQILDTFNRYPTSSWYALGDDDTLWIPQNVIQALAGFPADRSFFLGSVGEPVGQGVYGWSNGSAEMAVGSDFSAGRTMLTSAMAWGGGGMILSHKVMSKLNASLVPCFESKRHIYGSDERISLCVAETSKTELHILPGFHQQDEFDATFLFQTQPPSPVLSLHHLDRKSVMGNASRLGYNISEVNAAIAVHPYSFLQQRTCVGTIAGVKSTLQVSTGFDVRWQDRRFLFKRGDTHPRVAQYIYSELSSSKRSLMSTLRGRHNSLTVVQEIHGYQEDHWAANRRQMSCTASMTHSGRLLLAFKEQL